MNILYHHRTRGQGVEGVHIGKIVQALERFGYSVDVLSPDGLNISKGAASQKRDSSPLNNVISQYAPEFIFELFEIFYNFIAIEKIRKIIKIKNYDLIYERYAIFNWAGVSFAQKHEVPIILEVNYTATTPLYRKRSFFLTPYARWLDKKIFKHADGIVVVSGYLKQHLIDMGIEAAKIIILPNAADPERFNDRIDGTKVRNKLGLANKKVIGFVGGFYPWHGLDLLFEAFSRIKTPERNIVLLLIGDGPMRSVLEERIGQLGMQSEVIFTGKITHDELPEYIAAFDIAVMPDSNDYGSPMKIYEYMAMGKPVIGPRLGPLEEVIASGIEGILFEQGDSRELAEALNKLIQNEKLSKKMGQSARERIIKRHTWRKNAEEILKLYSQIKVGNQQ